MHDLISPPAMIQAAFDEARALAECRELIARRDEAKGEFKDAVLLLGQRLVAARKAMPGAPLPNGREHFSPAFVSFVEKTGLSFGTVKRYMTYARNPRQLESQRARERERAGITVSSFKHQRVKVLTEVAKLLAEAPDLATARRVIQEELNESV